MNTEITSIEKSRQDTSNGDINLPSLSPMVIERMQSQVFDEIASRKALAYAKTSGSSSSLPPMPIDAGSQVSVSLSSVRDLTFGSYERQKTFSFSEMYADEESSSANHVVRSSFDRRWSMDQAGQVFQQSNTSIPEIAPSAEPQVLSGVVTKDLPAIPTLDPTDASDPPGTIQENAEATPVPSHISFEDTSKTPTMSNVFAQLESSQPHSFKRSSDIEVESDTDLDRNPDTDLAGTITQTSSSEGPVDDAEDMVSVKSKRHSTLSFGFVDEDVDFDLPSVVGLDSSATESPKRASTFVEVESYEHGEVMTPQDLQSGSVGQEKYQISDVLVQASSKEEGEVEVSEEAHPSEEAPLIAKICASDSLMESLEQPSNSNVDELEVEERSVELESEMINEDKLAKPSFLARASQRLLLAEERVSSRLGKLFGVTSDPEPADTTIDARENPFEDIVVHNAENGPAEVINTDELPSQKSLPVATSVTPPINSIVQSENHEPDVLDVIEAKSDDNANDFALDQENSGELNLQALQNSVTFEETTTLDLSGKESENPELAVETVPVSDESIMVPVNELLPETIPQTSPLEDPSSLDETNAKQENVTIESKMKYESLVTRASQRILRAEQRIEKRLANFFGRREVQNDDDQDSGALGLYVSENLTDKDDEHIEMEEKLIDSHEVVEYQSQFVDGKEHLQALTSTTEEHLVDTNQVHSVQHFEDVPEEVSADESSEDVIVLGSSDAEQVQSGEHLSQVQFQPREQTTVQESLAAKASRSILRVEERIESRLGKFFGRREVVDGEVGENEATDDLSAPEQAVTPEESSEQGIPEESIQHTCVPSTLDKALQQQGDVVNHLLSEETVDAPSDKDLSNDEPSITVLDRVQEVTSEKTISVHDESQPQRSDVDEQNSERESIATLVSRRLLGAEQRIEKRLGKLFGRREPADDNGNDVDSNLDNCSHETNEITVNSDAKPEVSASLVEPSPFGNDTESEIAFDTTTDGKHLPEPSHETSDSVDTFHTNEESNIEDKSNQDIVASVDLEERTFETTELSDSPKLTGKNITLEDQQIPQAVEQRIEKRLRTLFGRDEKKHQSLGIDGDEVSEKSESDNGSRVHDVEELASQDTDLVLRSTSPEEIPTQEQHLAQENLQKEVKQSLKEELNPPDAIELLFSYSNKSTRNAEAEQILSSDQLIQKVPTSPLGPVLEASQPIETEQDFEVMQPEVDAKKNEQDSEIPALPSQSLIARASNRILRAEQRIENKLAKLFGHHNAPPIHTEPNASPAENAEDGSIEKDLIQEESQDITRLLEKEPETKNDAIPSTDVIHLEKNVSNEGLISEVSISTLSKKLVAKSVAADNSDLSESEHEHDAALMEKASDRIEELSARTDGLMDQDGNVDSQDQIQSLLLSAESESPGGPISSGRTISDDMKPAENVDEEVQRTTVATPTQGDNNTDETAKQPSILVRVAQRILQREEKVTQKLHKLFGANQDDSQAEEWEREAGEFEARETQTASQAGVETVTVNKNADVDHVHGAIMRQSEPSTKMNPIDLDSPSTDDISETFSRSVGNVQDIVVDKVSKEPFGEAREVVMNEKHADETSVILPAPGSTQSQLVTSQSLNVSSDLGHSVTVRDDESEKKVENAPFALNDMIPHKLDGASVLDNKTNAVVVNTDRSHIPTEENQVGTEPSGIVSLNDQSVEKSSNNHTVSDLDSTTGLSDVKSTDIDLPAVPTKFLISEEPIFKDDKCISKDNMTKETSVPEVAEDTPVKDVLMQVKEMQAIRPAQIVSPLKDSSLDRNRLIEKQTQRSSRHKSLAEDKIVQVTEKTTVVETIHERVGRDPERRQTIISEVTKITKLLDAEQNVLHEDRRSQTRVVKDQHGPNSSIPEVVRAHQAASLTQDQAKESPRLSLQNPRRVSRATASYPNETFATNSSYVVDMSQTYPMTSAAYASPSHESLLPAEQYVPLRRHSYQPVPAPQRYQYQQSRQQPQQQDCCIIL